MVEFRQRRRFRYVTQVEEKWDGYRLLVGRLRLTGTLISPTNLFLSQDWASRVNILKLVKWVRILVGVGLHEVFSSGIISVS
jgi:hypothetical protein